MGESAFKTLDPRSDFIVSRLDQVGSGSRDTEFALELREVVGRIFTADFLCSIVFCLFLNLFLFSADCLYKDPVLSPFHIITIYRGVVSSC